MVTKEAMNLNKKALAKKQYGAALSGFDVYASLQGRSAMPLVTKATGNASRVYRVGVLEIASGFMQAGDYKALAEQAKKLTGVEQKEDIIALIGNSGDASLVSLVKPYIGNANDGLNIAGMNAAALLGGEGVAVALVNQMKKAGASQKVVDVAKEALMTYKVNVDDIVGGAAAQGTEAGRVAALEILARRGAASKADLVL